MRLLCCRVIETEKIIAFEKLQEAKTPYVTEIEKTLESFDSFTKVIFSGSDTVQIANRLADQAPAVKAYVNVFHLSGPRLDASTVRPRQQASAAAAVNAVVH